MAEWMPIESAPKDRRAVVLVRLTGTRKEHVAWWDALDNSHPRWRLQTGAAWSEGPEGGPTHWKPLPEPRP